MPGIALIVNNSYSQIKGLPTGPFNQLRTLLSYKRDAKAAYFNGGYNHPIYMIDKKGYFPTGLLTKVHLFLESRSINYTFHNHTFKPDPLLSASINKSIIPYPDQLKIVDQAIKNSRGIISAPTGSGKSLIIALIAVRLNVRTLIIVPSLEIRKQLIASLASVLADVSKIIVENIDATILPNLKNFDCLIIDEAHHVAAKTYQKLNKTAWTKIYYRFFLTATPFRNDKEETLLFEGIAGELIAELSYKDAVNNKYIVPVEAYYVEIPKTTTDAFTWAEVYSQLVVKHTARNEIIAYIAVKLASLGKSTLVLTKEVAHCTDLAVKTGLPGVHGEDDESRKYITQFNEGVLNGIIGTSGILGEGVDTKPCEYVIIAGLGKAKSAFMQQVGRAVRTYPGKESAKVIIFKDSSHKFTLRHFREQVKILKEEYGVIPQKLDL